MASALSDDMLAEILLRLPEPADLVRASAACVPYRRLATDRAFLRRFRALHPAPLLGFLDQNGFRPALPPHASAPAARAVSLVADFSFSFIPSPSPVEDGKPWVVRDVRGGRVLLDRAPPDEDGGGGGGGDGPPVFTDVAVCDPLHRRCVLLPPVPADLAAAVDRPLRVEFDRWCEAFLVPSSHADDEEETSFQVICMVQCKARLVAFAFSSATGQWRAAASLPWRDLIQSSSVSGSGAAPRSPVIHGRQYARGRFYWTMDLRDKLLVLDTNTMRFSITSLPPGCHRRQIAIVEAAEDDGGGVGLFALRDHVADGEVSLHYYTVRREDSSGRWQVKEVIPLDPGFRHYIRGATERCVLLLRFPEHLSSSGVHVGSSEDGVELECFSLDVKSLKLEKMCGLKHHILRAHMYTNFPPSLSSPTI